MTVKDFAFAVKDAGAAWYGHSAFRFGAALAYYTVVSLAPLVLITVAILGLIFGHEQAQAQFQQQIQQVVGEDAGKAFSLVLRNAPKSQASGIVATVLGVIAFLGGYTGVFFELQSALNILWDIPPGPNQGFWASVRKMALSVGVMGVIGFLLLVSLAASAALSAVSDLFSPQDQGLLFLWRALNFLLSLGIVTVLFALVFKLLPDAHIAWGDVWIGALSTAVLFIVGKFAIGEYLGRSGVASSYGAAGSIIVLLLWVYYSALILFFGAELTRVYANRFGSKVVPATGTEADHHPQEDTGAHAPAHEHQGAAHA